MPHCQGRHQCHWGLLNLPYRFQLCTTFVQGPDVHVPIFSFAGGFLIMVGLRLLPYESHRYSKFNLNSLPLSYTRYQHIGYLLNQNLLTNRTMRSELLSKISSNASDSLPSTVIVLSRRTRGNSTILNQLDAGSIMVRAMKSMTEPSLPLRV
jgi:hypothetical protein